MGAWFSIRRMGLFDHASIIGALMISVKNKCPLPLIDAVVSPLHKAHFFIKLIRRHQGESGRPLGHFENLLMLFGLTNAPAVLKALMNDIWWEMLDMSLFVYIDDILIFPETQEEHVQHIWLVLQQLLEKQSFVKAEK